MRPHRTSSSWRRPRWCCSACCRASAWCWPDGGRSSGPRFPDDRHCGRSEAIHYAVPEMDRFVATLPCANASRLSQAMTGTITAAG